MRSCMHVWTVHTSRQTCRASHGHVVPRLPDVNHQLHAHDSEGVPMGGQGIPRCPHGEAQIMTMLGTEDQ